MEKTVTKRILVCGLPTSGKTTLSKNIALKLRNLDYEVDYYNADELRKQFNDWDFSPEGRERQAHRMKDLSLKSTADYVICDFVAPTEMLRTIFNADFTVWVDTIIQSPYEDTNKLFEAPKTFDYRVDHQYSDFHSTEILKCLKGPTFDYKKESVQMLGRFQPWHAGHRALFEKALEKTGQVVIMVRDCQDWNDSNPFDFEFVKKRIEDDLNPLYKEKFIVIKVPNIVEIVYGRDVGYKINKIELTSELHNISATKIRERMKENGEL
jgi:adenylylsulfate kinase-like enzyme/phosphopantetheine adenylyltransferase